MSAYTTRNSLLRKMGYPSYADYLSSKLWEDIRHRVFSSGRQCRLCLAKMGEMHLHHICYKKTVMTGDDLSKLIPLCAICHHRIEFTKKGVKRSLTQANYELQRLSRDAGREIFLKKIRRKP